MRTSRPLASGLSLNLTGYRVLASPLGSPLRGGQGFLASVSLVRVSGIPDPREAWALSLTEMAGSMSKKSLA